MVVAAPRSGEELRNLIHTALVTDKGPFAIRYPRDKAPDAIDWAAEPQTLPIGSWNVVREGRRVLVLATGTMVESARLAILHEELNVTLVNCRFIKPIDQLLLEGLLRGHELVLTLEEGTSWGGLGSHVALYMQEHGHRHPFAALSLPDAFVEHGPREQLLELCGLAEWQLAEVIRGMTRGELPVNGKSLEAAIVNEASRAQLGPKFPGFPRGEES
jgi:1-deoxy-D-xylulose-5-phosphate synthase